MFTALVIGVVGLVVGLGLAWLILSGVLSMAFKKVRVIVRRIRDRRHAPRPEADRRSSDHERRAER
jgi:hypothetical protein